MQIVRPLHRSQVRRELATRPLNTHTQGPLLLRRHFYVFMRADLLNGDSD